MKNQKTTSIQENKTDQKSIFSVIFLLMAVMMVILPFATTFNEVLTKAVEKSHLYMAIQNNIVPYEVKIIGVVLKPFGVNFLAHPGGMTINGRYMEMTWNCIGWQSLILLTVTFFVGLQGKWSRLSKLECVLLGVLGTFMINIFRISFTALLAAFWGELFGIIFHDYFAAFITIIWLIFFWWFSYAFVLQTKEIKNSK